MEKHFLFIIERQLCQINLFLGKCSVLQGVLYVRRENYVNIKKQQAPNCEARIRKLLGKTRSIIEMG